MIRDTWLFSRPQVEVWDISMHYICQNSNISIILTKVNISNILLLRPFPKAPVAGPREEDSPFFVGTLLAGVFVQRPPRPLLSGLLSVETKQISNLLHSATLCRKETRLVCSHRTAVCTFFGVESVERSELALCFEGAGLQGIW